LYRCLPNFYYRESARMTLSEKKRWFTREGSVIYETTHSFDMLASPALLAPRSNIIKPSLREPSDCRIQMCCELLEC